MFAAMGKLTEAEIFDCMTCNLRLAAEDCMTLAKSARKGPTYDALRRRLKLIEGACRQAAYWRQDARWLPMGLLMEEAHKRAGDWLRGVKMPNGERVSIPSGEMHPLFVKLAENLKHLLRIAEGVRDNATHRSGIILPAAQRRPVKSGGALKMSPGGILIPSGA